MASPPNGILYLLKLLVVQVTIMKRTREHNNEVSYHHARSIILLIAFAILMTAITCLFAYLFDQIFGFGKSQASNHVHRSIRQLITQSSTHMPSGLHHIGTDIISL